MLQLGLGSTAAYRYHWQLSMLRSGGIHALYSRHHRIQQHSNWVSEAGYNNTTGGAKFINRSTGAGYTNTTAQGNIGDSGH